MVPDLAGLTLYLERQLRPPRHYVSEKEIRDKCQIDGRLLEMLQFRGGKHLLKSRVIKMVCFMEDFIDEKTSEKW